MVEGDDGTLWISYARGAVCCLKDGKTTVLSTQLGSPLSSIRSLARDTKGRIWIARNGEVGIFRDGRFQSLAQPGDRSIQLAAASAGGVWVCARRQLFHFDENAALEKVGEIAPANYRIDPSAMIEDHQGAVWVGTAYDGLFRFDGTRFEKIATSHPEILSLLEDSEGNIWVGTHGGGLDRLRHRAITLENAQNGLPFEAVQSICEDTNQTLWAVAENGVLARRGANGWQTISTNTGWPGGTATCVASDRDGSIWIGTRDYRLVHFQDGRFEALDRSSGLEASPISTLMVDNAGALWIGGVNHTLQFLRAGHFIDVPLREDTHSIRAIAQDPTGAIWIGTSRGLLLRINGTNEVNETEKISGVSKSIRCLYAAPDGNLWIGYAGFGLGRFKSGQFSQITTAQGLLDDYISQIVPDGQGWYWFGADRGIFKVRERGIDSGF